MKPTGDGREQGFDRLLGREFSRPAATADDCPQVELLSAWFDRSLPASEAASVEAHVSSCGRCQELVGHLARTEPEVLYVHPKREARGWTWHLRWAAPLAVAAMVVFVVGTRSLFAPDTGMPFQAPLAAPEKQIAQNQDRALVAPKDSSATPTPQREAPPPAAERRMARAKTEPAASPAPVPTAAPAQAAPARPIEAAPAAPIPAAPAPQVPPESVRVTDVAAQAGALNQAGKAEAPREDKRAVPVRALGSASLALESTSAAQPSAFVPGSPVGWRYARPGVLVRTLDGGATWMQQALPGNVRVLALSAVSTSVCWAAGAAGAILRTVDGTTWQVIAGPTTEDIASIAALDERRVTLRTTSGVSYDTGDGGATWRRR